MPETSAVAVLYTHKIVVIQAVVSQRAGVQVHKTAALVVIGVEQNHVVAETNEESVLVVG